jgi:hypothetical protein
LGLFIIGGGRGGVLEEEGRLEEGMLGIEKKVCGGFEEVFGVLQMMLGL